MVARDQLVFFLLGIDPVSAWIKKLRRGRFVFIWTMLVIAPLVFGDVVEFCSVLQFFPVTVGVSWLGLAGSWGVFSGSSFSPWILYANSSLPARSPGHTWQALHFSRRLLKSWTSNLSNRMGSCYVCGSWVPATEPPAADGIQESTVGRLQAGPWRPWGTTQLKQSRWFRHQHGNIGLTCTWWKGTFLLNQKRRTWRKSLWNLMERTGNGKPSRTFTPRECEWELHDRGVWHSRHRPPPITQLQLSKWRHWKAVSSTGLGAHDTESSGREIEATLVG